MNFSTEQTAVIESQAMRLLVLAGPGAGKTATMIERGKYLLRERLVGTPQELLYLTFTNKAAAEMAERFDEDPRKRPTVGTFHSFAYHTLLLYGDEIGLRCPFAVIDENSQADVIDAICSDYSWVGTPTKILKFVRWINDKCRARSTPKLLKGMEAKDCNLLLGEYQRRTRESGIMGYSDLLGEMARLVEDPGITARLRMQFKAVFLDESQDMDVEQIALVERICSADSFMTVVADVDQAVFCWRDARPEILLGHEVEGRRYFIGWDRLNLTTNYRSGFEIVEASRRLIEHNEMKSGIPLQFFEGEARVEAITWPKPQFDARLVEKVEEMLVEGSLGILARTNREANLVAETLRFVGKDVHLAGEMGEVWGTLSGRIIKAILRRLLNPHDVWAERFLTKTTGSFAETYKQTKESIDSPDMLAELVEHLFLLMSGIGMVKESERVRDELQRLVDDGASISDALYCTTMDPEAMEEVPDGHIWVSTVHRAKGREFDSVIMCGCSDKFWPARWIKETEEDEERRTFYVAMTRARSWLVMLVEEGRDQSKYITEALPGSKPLDVVAEEIPADLFDGKVDGHD